MFDINQSSDSSTCNVMTTRAPASFLSLPGELRNRIYELVLVHQDPISPWAHPHSEDDRHQRLTPALLRASKAVHREASSLFYALNRFELTACASDDVASFFYQIGLDNAKSIQHIYIDFPKIHYHYLYYTNVKLGKNSIDILTNIQRFCNNLSTLTASFYCLNDMLDLLEGLGPERIIEALELIDTRFKAIPSLKEIVVEIYEDEGNERIVDLSEFLRERMENHGWIISTVENVEDVDSGSCLDDFDEYVYSDDDAYDGYDIDGLDDGGGVP